MDAIDLDAVNRAEIYRYLGAKDRQANEETRALVEECLGELMKKVAPRHVYRTFPLKVLPAENGEKPLIDFTCFQTNSESLYRNLRDCDEVLLFAATIGDGADFLIRRYEKTQMSKAIVCQAAAAELIETYCNDLNDRWKEAYETKGKKLRPRFSCGYGDFALSHQKDFMRVLEMDKRLNIRLTEGLLMVPTKSVTAIIGAEG